MDTSLPDLDAFLEMFPDPDATFYGAPAAPLPPPTAAYMEHASSQLRNDYTRLSVPCIARLLVAHSHRYAPTVRALDEALGADGAQGAGGGTRGKGGREKHLYF